MSKFRILICEDIERDLNLIDGYLKNIKAIHTGTDFAWKQANFHDIFTKIEEDEYDLLILDMYEGQTKEGENVLSYMENINKKITTIIYTNAGKDDDFYALKGEYPFLYDFIVKGEKGRKLKKVIEKIVFQYIDNLFEPYDDDDPILNAQIQSIGANNINEILFKIKSDDAFTGKYIINKLSSGYSGAAIFKLLFNSNSYILKLSKQKSTLENEFANASKLYKRFPDHLTINIHSKSYSNDEVTAILVKEVSSSKTLFDLLTDCNDQQTINNIFNDLYFATNSLREHYKDQRSTQEEKFDFIFQSLGNEKVALISQTMQELKPLLDEFNGEFDVNNLKSFVTNHAYRNINKNFQLGDQFKKKLVLSHGDFHSKNILIQGARSVLIDTGGVRFDYWCIDISRLIVNIFITGFDSNTKDYFDIGLISKNLNKAKQIIDMQTIDIDGINDGFIHAVNWLLENMKNIYQDLFIQWQFRLGLAKEFLQAAYRLSIPPNKRTIALIAAQYCLDKVDVDLAVSKP